MRIAVTGATGFLGRPLVQRLRVAGHTVVTIGRSPDTSDVVWDGQHLLEPAALAGVEAVLHLAGEPIAQRWERGVKARIRESRVGGTGLVARTLAALDARPSVFVSMSAIGYYGDRGDESLDESSARGRGFLAETAEAWEAAADPARKAGIRVVHPRLGIVLHPGGGALGKMKLPFSLGAGGRIGSGRQWMSWIARSDAVRALEFLLHHSLDGPVNLTAPHPVMNADFTTIYARALHRPAFTVVPAFAIRLLYGEMGEEALLGGQRVYPRKLDAAGFAFRYPNLAEAFAGEGV